MNSTNQNQGIIYIVIGSFLLFLFGGSILVPILGTSLGLVFINYGLQLYGYPPLLVTIQRFLDYLRYQFSRR